MGQTYQRMVSLFRDAAARPVEIRDEIRDRIDWENYSERLNLVRFPREKFSGDRATVRELRQRLATEIEFRSSSEVERIYRILDDVKKENGITRFEVDRNIFLRRQEIEYQSEDSRFGKLWDSRFETVVTFHQHLEERGIHLVFMPVPNQVDIVLPGFVSSENFSSSSPQHTRFLLRLAESGVDVIDLRYEMGMRSLSGEPMFNRFDHHWTPKAVEIGAKHLANRIRVRSSVFPEEPLVPFDYETVFFYEPVISFPFRWETKRGTPIFARSVQWAGETYKDYPASRIVILGDSMSRIYADPHASDLGAHLSALLGYPCATIGKGSGSPHVPRMFFSHYGIHASKSDPDFVVWVGVSRHQDYQPIAENDLSNPQSGFYRVTVVDRPPFPDFVTAPYPDALYAFEALVKKQGSTPRTAKVVAFAFNDRTLAPTGALKRGEIREMNLVSWRDAVKDDPSLLRVEMIDETFSLRIPEFFWNGK